jgi:ketosteroid isomerase-like protein
VSENLEVVRRPLEAYSRLDADAFLESVTADFEWFPTVSGSLAGAILPFSSLVDITGWQ